ncbi:MAG: rsfS [Solimicrobium sp.]|jgi:ribosome-associated protein|nr:rsfS [Solimicrobium sp.]
MDIKKLQKLVVDALEDVKAQDIKMYDTTHLTGLFDRVCIASGTSNRQTKALASSVREKVKENGGHVVGIEGEDIGEWVLVDLGDMVVHIMQPVIRGYYRLEELWGDKEVKIGSAKRLSKRSTEAIVEEGLVKEPAKRVRSTVNQATQTTLDDEIKKPVRKPRATIDVTAEAKPKRISRVKTTTLDEGTKTIAKKTASRKKAIGTTVKVAASKTAVASAKQAAAKRVTNKRKAAV